MKNQNKQPLKKLRKAALLTAALSIPFNSFSPLIERTKAEEIIQPTENRDVLVEQYTPAKKIPCGDSCTRTILPQQYAGEITQEVGIGAKAYKFKKILINPNWFNKNKVNPILLLDNLGKIYDEVYNRDPNNIFLANPQGPIRTLNPEVAPQYFFYNRKRSLQLREADWALAFHLDFPTGAISRGADEQVLEGLWTLDSFTGFHGDDAQHFKEDLPGLIGPFILRAPVFVCKVMMLAKTRMEEEGIKNPCVIPPDYSRPQKQGWKILIRNRTEIGGWTSYLAELFYADDRNFINVGPIGIRAPGAKLYSRTLRTDDGRLVDVLFNLDGRSAVLYWKFRGDSTIYTAGFPYNAWIVDWDGDDKITKNDQIHLDMQKVEVAFNYYNDKGVDSIQVLTTDGDKGILFLAYPNEGLIFYAPKVSRIPEVEGYDVVAMNK